MADTAIVEHTELALASVVRDRALLYDSLVLVLAFGPCFACSCDQKVLTCLLVSSRRSFYIVFTVIGSAVPADSSNDDEGFMLRSLCGAHTFVISTKFIKPLLTNTLR